MECSDEEIGNFKAIYKKEFNEDISDIEAKERFDNLNGILFVTVVILR